MKTLSYDLHIHSCLSPCGDNDMTPAMIAGMAKVIGLDLIALTDHNSCKNCPAAWNAAQAYGLQFLPGMELTTSEEVHVLCYFSTLQDSMNFDACVSGHLPPVPNKPALFGEQRICDEEDQILGIEERLLISATDISFSNVYHLVNQYHGVMVPAHINKPTTSLLGNLGFIPPDSQFTCAEVKNEADWPLLQQQFPYLAGCHHLCSSDAHDLNSIHEPIYTLAAEHDSPAAVLAAIQKKL